MGLCRRGRSCFTALALDWLISRIQYLTLLDVHKSNGNEITRLQPQPFQLPAPRCLELKPWELYSSLVPIEPPAKPTSTVRAIGRLCMLSLRLCETLMRFVCFNQAMGGTTMWLNKQYKLRPPTEAAMIISIKQTIAI